ncbi:class I SAM-dependent methyltransferase [Cryptosporangium sp. NPDC051539]|uniref:class I SAM-dependent methyltransferase n=1 Tax=Cryptosporangium sp. NPDC051539 TaxID=3363962 RepID=UPI0037912D07
MPGDQSNVRASYDLVASAYADDLYDELEAKPADRALLGAFLELAGDGPVADVGCGPGQVTRFLAGTHPDVVGLDLSPAMIAEARRRAPGVRFVVGTMTDLPAATDTLAGVVAFYSLIHLTAAERRRTYREFSRVLRPGGSLLLAFHVDDASVDTGGVRHLSTWFGAKVDLDFHFLDPDEVAADLAAAGVTVVSSTIRVPGEGEYPSRRCYLLARNRPDPAAPAVTSVRPVARRRSRTSRILTTLLPLLLVFACCCGGCEKLTRLPSSQLFVADRPDVHSTKFTAARHDAEQRIRQTLAVPAPPGAKPVAETHQATCYPGSHGLKHNDEFDNLCLVRITAFYSLRGSTLAAATEAMDRHLRGAGWQVRRPVGHGLIDPVVRAVRPEDSGTPRSAIPATYHRNSDEVSITFGPDDGDFLEQATHEQTTVGWMLFDPYWTDDTRIDQVSIWQKLRGAGGDAGITITAQREFYRNG